MKKRQPVADRLVEGAEDARLVGVAGVALEQLLGLLAAVAAEVGVQQIDHRPQVAALLDVHLEQVAQVVERRRGVAEQALLLDRGGLGVALGDDQAAQRRAILARHLLPGRLADVVAEADRAVRLARRRGRCPSGSRASARSRRCAQPSASTRRRGAQIDVVGLEVARAHLVPPVEERAAASARARAAACGSSARSTLFGMRLADSRSPCAMRLDPSPSRIAACVPLPKSLSAPCSPIGVGADEDPVLPGRQPAEDLASPCVSGPAKRRLASMPVSASGDRLARSSMARRISSSQSSSSGATVTRPSVSAASASSGLPDALAAASMRRGVAAEARLRGASGR